MFLSLYILKVCPQLNLSLFYFAFYHITSLGDHKELTPNKGVPGINLSGFKYLLDHSLSVTKTEKSLALVSLEYHIPQNTIGTNISTYEAVCVCVCVCVLIAQSCLTLCDTMDCSPRGSSLCPWNSPDKNTGAGSHSLLQGIFPTQGWNPSLNPGVEPNPRLNQSPAWQADSLLSEPLRYYM